MVLYVEVDPTTTNTTVSTYQVIRVVVPVLSKATSPSQVIVLKSIFEVLCSSIQHLLIIIRSRRVKSPLICPAVRLVPDLRDDGRED